MGDMWCALGECVGYLCCVSVWEYYLFILSPIRIKDIHDCQWSGGFPLVNDGSLCVNMRYVPSPITCTPSVTPHTPSHPSHITCKCSPHSTSLLHTILHTLIYPSHSHIHPSHSHIHPSHSHPLPLTHPFLPLASISPTYIHPSHSHPPLPLTSTPPTHTSTPLTHPLPLTSTPPTHIRMSPTLFHHKGSNEQMSFPPHGDCQQGGYFICHLL